MKRIWIIILIINNYVIIIMHHNYNYNYKYVCTCCRGRLLIGRIFNIFFLLLLCDCDIAEASFIKRTYNGLVGHNS